MTVDLTKNKSAIVQAWTEVVDDKNPIDWYVLSLNNTFRSHVICIFAVLLNFMVILGHFLAMKDKQIFWRLWAKEVKLWWIFSDVV